MAKGGLIRQILHFAALVLAIGVFFGWELEIRGQGWAESGGKLPSPSFSTAPGAEGWGYQGRVDPQVSAGAVLPEESSGLSREFPQAWTQPSHTGGGRPIEPTELGVRRADWVNESGRSSSLSFASQTVFESQDTTRPLAAAGGQDSAVNQPNQSAVLAASEETGTARGTPLPGPSHSGREVKREVAGNGSKSGGAASSRLVWQPVTLFLILASMVVLIIGGAWLLKQTSPRSAGVLSSEVFEVLGRSWLTPRTVVHLVRCGNRVLLLSVSGENAETLAEITEPDEVTEIVALCRQGKPGSISDSFSQVFRQMVSRKIRDTEAVLPERAVN